MEIHLDAPQAGRRTRGPAVPARRTGIYPPAITFLGGAGGVTGSRFLVEHGGSRVLVDAGLFQGLKALRLRNRDPFPVDPASIDAVLLTHAHLDHVGYLPALINAGFAGPVLATRSTGELAAIVLADAGRLQEEEADYANRKGFSRHHPAVPLFTEEDGRRAAERFSVVEFGKTIGVAPEIHGTFQPAGHILGSAGVTLRLDGRTTRRVFVSGDVGRPHHPILKPPWPIPPAEVVLIESTYGDRTHESEEEAIDRLADIVCRTAARGGVVVIPSFAVDRTEVVLLALRRLTAAGRIPTIPVYVDSPMALAVLRAYRRAVADGDPEVALGPGAGDPFDPGWLEEVPDAEESRALHGVRYPAVIISASGMATGGRVLHHLANRLPDHRNTVILVGFQAEGTRGRLLGDGARSLKMLGRYVHVRAEIQTIDSFSVHADAGELVAWAGTAAHPPEMAFVVHGDPAASEALRGRLEAELGWPAVVPKDGERVRVD